MTRNWGISPKDGPFPSARRARPLMSLSSAAIYGIFAASLAGLSFSGARGELVGLFRGPSVIAAVIAGGFGCWAYVFLAWRRFAAQFSGGDAFSDLIRFYARGAVALAALYFGAQGADRLLGGAASGLLLCLAGGAAAAAAFQTVLTFVPPETANPKSF